MAAEQFGCSRDGMLAESLLANEQALVKVPTHRSFEAAARSSALLLRGDGNRRFDYQCDAQPSANGGGKTMSEHNLHDTDALRQTLHAPGPAPDRASHMMLYGQFVGAWDGTLVYDAG